MRDIENDVSPESMARANEANYVATMSMFACVYGGEVVDEPDMLWYATGVPIGFLNGVIRAHLAPEHVDDRIAWAIERGRARNLPFSWMIAPSARPSGLGDRLVRRGFVDGGETPAMAVELAHLPAVWEPLPG